MPSSPAPTSLDPAPAAGSGREPVSLVVGSASRAALVVYKGPVTEDPDRRTLAYGKDRAAAEESLFDQAAEPEQPQKPGSTSVGHSPPLAVPSGTSEVEPDRRRIGDFLVRRLIGEGGMGKVYEAEERLSKRRVALKVLRSELSRSEAGRRQFVNEMAILASLDDPHVVRCLHCTEVDGELVMALEYLEGETLRSRMSRDRVLAWDEVVGIAWQIAAALSAAHRGEQPIIHRDLKPENVMLIDGGRVKVMDFGIAKILQAVAGNTTHSVGTLQYMSPEQIDARPLTPRSDLYSLGLVMWELLAGHPPFESESPRVLLDKLCTEPAPPLPAAARRGLPRGVEQLIQQLLEKSADDRPADAAEVLERLEPFRPVELSHATKSGHAGHTTSPGRTRTVSSEGSTEPSGSQRAAEVSLTPLPTPSSSGARELTPKRFDTVAMVEKASGPRDIPAKLAVTIIVSLSLAAGLVTWLIRLLTI
jgi:serine/threonine protein kinase